MVGVVMWNKRRQNWINPSGCIGHSRALLAALDSKRPGIREAQIPRVSNGYPKGRQTAICPSECNSAINVCGNNNHTAKSNRQIWLGPPKTRVRNPLISIIIFVLSCVVLFLATYLRVWRQKSPIQIGLFMLEKRWEKIVTEMANYMAREGKKRWCDWF